MNLDKIHEEFITARDRYHEVRRAAEESGQPHSEPNVRGSKAALKQYSDATARYAEALMGALGFVPTPKRK